MDWTVFTPIILALIAPVGAYALAVRRMSGRVNTSTATELWQEASDIRIEQRVQGEKSFERIVNLEKRVANLEGINTGLVRTNFELQNRIIELETLVKTLYNTIEDLQIIIKEKDEIIEEEA